MPNVDWTWFLIGTAFGYLVLAQLLGLVMGLFSSVTGSAKRSGGASPTGYPVNEGRY